MPTSATSPAPRTVALPGGLAVTVQEFGENTEGTGVLVLHGGAGPRTVAGISAALSEHAYVVTPTHPGFDGTPAQNASTPSPTWPSPTWTCSTRWTSRTSW